MRGITTWAIRAAFPAVLALLLAGAGARADDALTIDRALRKQAPEVLKVLRAQKYKTVGVLKFLAGYDDKNLRDNLGAINRTLADRLEVALVMRMTEDDEDQMCLLTRASDAVAQSGDRTLTHRTAEGRAAFFANPSLRIPRAWGRGGPALADAFLTGEAVVSPDCRTVRLRIQIFDRKNPDGLKTIGDWFTAAADPRMLTECDVSFVRSKGVKDDEDDTPRKELDSIAVAFRPTLPDPFGRTTPTPAPVLPPPVLSSPAPEKDWDDLLSKTPLKVDILYNDVPAKVKNGAVQTPSANDKVAFHLKNTDPSVTYGVVLKINGESTIEHQTLPPLDCYKWVLAPGQEVTITGFQVGAKNAEQFQVLPTEASKGQEMNYGDNAGVFTLVAFRAANKEETAFVHNDDTRNEDVKAISRGSLTCKDCEGVPPVSLQALQDALTPKAIDASSAKNKGLIVAGATGDSKIEHVDFTPFPREELSLVVPYYRPGK